MLTLLITVETPIEDFSVKHSNFLKIILDYETDIEVIFVVKENYSEKDALRLLASQLPNHQLIVLDERNNINEMILMGLSQSRGEEVLLCTWDTELKVVEEVLKKRKEGNELVFVRKKRSKFTKFIEKIGLSAYNTGLKLIGKNSDLFCEPNIQLMDGRVANLICANPVNCFELRTTNDYKQLKQSIVEEEKIYKYTPTKKTTAMSSLGWVTIIYSLCLISLAIIYPFFNNLIYSWWALIALFIWIIAGGFGLIYSTKQIYKYRNKFAVRIAENGEVATIVKEHIYFGIKEINFETEFAKEVDKLYNNSLSKENNKEKENEKITVTTETHNTKPRVNKKSSTDKKIKTSNKTSKQSNTSKKSSSTKKTAKNQTTAKKVKKNQTSTKVDNNKTSKKGASKK